MDKDKKLLERYYELEKLIKGINIVNFPGEDDSLEEMNKWISKIIEFYKRCGINLSYNDFKDPFDKRTSNYMKIEIILIVMSLQEYYSLLEILILLKGKIQLRMKFN